MTANTTLNPGALGDVIRTIDRSGTGPKTQVVQLDVGGGGASESLVAAANPLPIRIYDGTGASPDVLAYGGGNSLEVAAAGVDFISATGNSSTVQLAASATFTGSIETVYNQPDISVLLTIDQNATLTLNQYIDAGGTRKISAWTFSIVAGVPFSRCFTANGNYFNLTLQNNGASTTTTLNLNVAYGTLTPATNLGNMPMSLNEVNGTAVSLGQTTMAASLPVTIASNQSTINVATDTQSKTTYTATLARVATGALTANTLKQVMSFEHAAGSTKTMRLRSLKISGYATTAVAGTVEFQLFRGTAASTAGTAVTPTPCVPGTAAADTVVKSLPTITAATVLAAGNATAVPATANSSIGTATEYLFEAGIDGGQDFTLRAGNLDTLLLSIISTGAINVTLNVTAAFTEE